METGFISSFSKGSKVYTGTYPVLLGGAINCVGASAGGLAALPNELCTCESLGYSTIPNACWDDSNIITTQCLNGQSITCYKDCVVPILGCTNSLASNYNPMANVDDGSCIFGYFKGFQIAGTYYTTYTFTDWDTPLYGAGIQPDTNVGPFSAPSWRVDGHSTFLADGSGNCTVINSTGSNMISFPIGSTYTVNYIESAFSPTNIQNNYYSAILSRNIDYFKGYLENQII